MWLHGESESKICQKFLSKAVWGSPLPVPTLWLGISHAFPPFPGGAGGLRNGRDEVYCILVHLLLTGALSLSLLPRLQPSSPLNFSNVSSFILPALLPASMPILSGSPHCPSHAPLPHWLSSFPISLIASVSCCHAACLCCLLPDSCFRFGGGSAAGGRSHHHAAWPTLFCCPSKVLPGLGLSLSSHRGSLLWGPGWPVPWGQCHLCRGSWCPVSLPPDRYYKGYYGEGPLMEITIKTKKSNGFYLQGVMWLLL